MRQRLLSFFTLEGVALFYLGIPLILFLAFWVTAPYNFLFITLLLLSAYKLWREKNIPAQLQTDNYFNIRSLILLGLIALIMAFLAGAGAYAQQTGDYPKHNFVFYSLIENAWPVAFQYNDGTNVNLVYYLGYYLIPALVGKFSNETIFNLFTLSWAAAGLFLGFCIFLKYNKLPWWFIILFLFLGSLDFIGALFSKEANILNTNTYSLWAMPFRLLPPMDSLIFGMQHFIPFIIVGPLSLAYLEQKNWGMAWLWVTLSLFWSPFAGLSLLAFFIYPFLKNPKNHFLPSLGLFLSIVLPLFIFYFSKIQSERVLFMGNSQFFHQKYLPFFLLSFGFWLFFINKELWKTNKLITSLILLLLIPFFTMGEQFDWEFRIGAIPFYFVAGMAFTSIYQNKNKLTLFYLFLIYLFSIITPATIISYVLKSDFFHPQCKQEHRNFLQRMDRVAKQYLGIYQKDSLSEQVLAKTNQPKFINKTWEEAQITNIFGGANKEIFSTDGNSSMLYCSPFSGFLLVSDKEYSSVKITFKMQSLLGEPIKILLGQKRASPRTFATPLEILQNDLFNYPKNDKEALFENKANFVINPELTPVTIDTALHKGKNLFQIVADISLKDKADHSNIFTISDFRLKINPDVK